MVAMDPLLLLVVGIILLVFVLGLVLFYSIRKAGPKEQGETPPKRQKSRDKQVIIREANKKLAQNPKDTGALLALADIYYNDKDWEKAHKAYALLVTLCSSHPELDEFQLTLRHAIAAMNLRQFEEAYKGLLIARTMNADVFEINYNLGIIEYKRKNYEKAALYLAAAARQQPNHIQTLKHLGVSQHRLKMNKDAIATLKQVIDQRPDDKEAIFYQAQAYYESGQAEMAVSLFTHLRPDPAFGPQAALMSGSLHLKAKNVSQAIIDFELGLKHENIRKDVDLELRYRLAAAYMRLQDVSNAMAMLRHIHAIQPDYKDVDAQLRKNSELSQNQNLQVYLIAPESDFVALCRRIVEVQFRRSHVKISDIQVRKGEYADVLAEVETAGWADTVLFRFIRSSGQIGEFLLRDLYTRIKEVKAGRGLCFCAGTYSEGALAFVEARFIDLIDKDNLLKILNQV